MILIPNDILSTNRLRVMVDGEEIDKVYKVDTTNGYVYHYVVRDGNEISTEKLYGDITFKID